MMQMNIDDIKISDQFLRTTPSSEKMERFEKYWLLTNHQDKPIVIDKCGYLVDGYIRYLIMKRNGAKKIRTVYKGQPGALIKGVHINYDGIGMKEYIWRVPRVKGWRKFINNLQIGDVVLCVTKKGVKPVKVTEIQTENIIDGREYSKVLINKKIEVKTK